MFVHHFIWPCVLAHLLMDQYAFRPTGNTSAAIIDLLHQVTIMLETNNYVRFLLIDYSRVFNVIDHGILLNMLHTLYISDSLLK